MDTPAAFSDVPTTPRSPVPRPLFLNLRCPRGRAVRKRPPLLAQEGRRARRKDCRRVGDNGKAWDRHRPVASTVAAAAAATTGAGELAERAGDRGPERSRAMVRADDHLPVAHAPPCSDCCRWCVKRGEFQPRGCAERDVSARSKVASGGQGGQENSVPIMGRWIFGQHGKGFSSLEFLNVGGVSSCERPGCAQICSPSCSPVLSAGVTTRKGLPVACSTMVLTCAIA